jgi:hypothetical protein
VSYTSFYTVYGFISLDRNTINRFIALPDNALIVKVPGGFAVRLCAFGLVLYLSFTWRACLVSFPHWQGHCTMGYPINQIMLFNFLMPFLHGISHFRVNFKLSHRQNGISQCFFTISRFFIVILHKIKALPAWLPAMYPAISYTHPGVSYFILIMGETTIVDLNWLTE